MESELSESNILIRTTKDLTKMFFKIYWRTLIIIIVPLLLIPVLLISEKQAYKVLYVFIVMVIYWAADVMHPSVIALVALAFSYLFSGMGFKLINEIYLRSDAIECVGVMMMMAAIEYSKVQLRIAFKILLIFGCSHYRLSFLLFFSSMFLSMWISSTLTCGLMMTLVKAILMQLEKIGLLEIFQTVGKKQQHTRHEQNLPRPTDFTVFYFLGVAYSSSIGEIATITGSQPNQIFKIYCETIFPAGPKIEFPHLMLLNLPGVLVMESLLYIWMNFYFLGLFRSRSEIAIDIDMTEEEAQYVTTLLDTDYSELGDITFHEMVVSGTVVLTAILQTIFSSAAIVRIDSAHFHDHLHLSSHCILTVVLLFIIPVNLDFIKFFRRRNSTDSDLLPTTTTKSCLNWDLVESSVHWSIPFIIICSSAIFESFRESGLVEELEKFLHLFEGWPSSLLVLVTVLTCKILTEFASNSSVVYALLPTFAKLSLSCHINPHYLMMAATLGSSLSFHLMPGAPVNALVCTYLHIPPWKMMYAGIGPSILAILIIWATVVLWSMAVWTDITLYPDWVNINIIEQLSE